MKPSKVCWRKKSSEKSTSRREKARQDPVQHRDWWPGSPPTRRQGQAQVRCAGTHAGSPREQLQSSGQKRGSKSLTLSMASRQSPTTPNISRPGWRWVRTFGYRTAAITVCSGGVEITLDAEKMGELLNLNPKLVLEDCNISQSHYEDLMLDI